MNNDNIFDFISTLPEVVDIIGYGSGVKNQEGYTDDIKRQIDLILTVNDIYEFHKLNFKKSFGQTVNNSSQSMSIQIGSISLPEVKDGQGFVDYLQNFSADITQQSFRRV